MFGRGMRTAICVLIFVAGLAGCQSREKHFALKGEILAKNNALGRLSVDHEEIPGFMPAMTMEYKVKDPQGLQQAQTGDRITADVVVDSNNDTWLEHIVVVDSSKRGAVVASKPHELLPGETVPDVPLVNQDGKTLRLGDFKGQAVLVTFIYTRCPFPTFCPLISSQFAAIHGALAQMPVYAKTHLLSVSLDPSYDTPPVLRKYGLAYLKDDASGFKNWDFASSSADDLPKLASAFGLQYFVENGQITHTMNTILIGPDGAVKQTWPGNGWKTLDVLTALKQAAS